jgi:hypothetical protein
LTQACGKTIVTDTEVAEMFEAILVERIKGRDDEPCGLASTLELR